MISVHLTPQKKMYTPKFRRPYSQRHFAWNTRSKRQEYKILLTGFSSTRILHEKQIANPTRAFFFNSHSRNEPELSWNDRVCKVLEDEKNELGKKRKHSISLRVFFFALSGFDENGFRKEKTAIQISEYTFKRIKVHTSHFYMQVHKKNVFAMYTKENGERKNVIKIPSPVLAETLNLFSTLSGLLSTLCLLYQRPI